MLLDIMTNNNNYLVDIEARVVHLKSKELLDTQQVVDSGNLSRIQLLVRVAQFHLIAAKLRHYRYLP